jgi:hypothetical protein
MNLIGAILLTIYGFLLFAWASVALNAIWGTIALVALVRAAKARDETRIATSEAHERDRPESQHS